MKFCKKLNVLQYTRYCCYKTNVEAHLAYFFMSFLPSNQSLWILTVNVWINHLIKILCYSLKYSFALLKSNIFLKIQFFIANVVVYKKKILCYLITPEGLPPTSMEYCWCLDKGFLELRCRILRFRSTLLSIIAAGNEPYAFFPFVQFSSPISRQI